MMGFELGAAVQGGRFVGSQEVRLRVRFGCDGGSQDVGLRVRCGGAGGEVRWLTGSWA